MRSGVRAEVHRAASAQQQQLGFRWVLANVEDKFVCRQAVRNRRPMLTQIGSLKDIRFEIVPHVPPGGQPGGLFVGVGRLNTTDPGFGQPRWGHFLPVLPPVCGNVDETIVGPGPNNGGIERRNCER